MQHIRHALSLFCVATSFLIADQTAPAEPTTPWLTGPLLTPSAHVIPNGHFNIEPYEYVTTNFKVYNPHWDSKSITNIYNVISQTFVQIGMPCNLDFTFTPQWAWNHRSGASHWVLNDMSFGFDYQLYAGTALTSSALRLAIRGNFPIGKYQKLNPKYRGMDIGGTGSWYPGIGLAFSDLVWFGGHYFFAPRANVQYAFPTPVHVKNYNAYGGGHHTRGKVYPGQYLLVQFGFEVTLSQRWAFANDFQYVHTNRTRFKGHKGATNGVPNRIGLPSSEQFSVAPAIEYNWNAYIGIIAGAWFTFAGRNSLDFASGVVAVNIYH